MAVTRRRIVLAALAVPAAIGVARLTGSLVAVAPLIRPGADGSSATRCAACGAAGHSMLDPRCPAAPRVLG